MIENQQNLEEVLFQLAEQKSSAAERAAFLDGVCRDNPVLRERLEVLLEGHFGADEFLTESFKRPSPSTSAAESKALDIESDAQGPVRMIGRYKLIEKLGEGGFGEVWMAEQREPVKRRVALKVIKMGMDTTQIVARFEAERQALALMDHPNIARVLDAGSTDSGRPFFVMELVIGQKLSDYCKRNQLSVQQRLELFLPVCRGVQHAHQKGIIHRDLKPSNILVTEHEGVAIPKVIDFGIAKAIEQPLLQPEGLTSIHAFVGTPPYISPEQVQFGARDVDTRSDIYSLGVILYELLTGVAPFDLQGASLENMCRIIRETEPQRPSVALAKNLQQIRLRSPRLAWREQVAAVRGDLDCIVLKCLEKDRARRYETANGLARDIQRYLSNETVAARPPTAFYRFQKTVRRNKLAFAATALVTLLTIFGASAVIFVQHRANQDYRHRLYLSEVSGAGTAWQAGQSTEMLALLDRCPADLRHWEWEFLRKQADRWDQTIFFATTNLADAFLSADRRLVAIATGDVLQIRDFPSGQWLRDIPFKLLWFSRLAISPRDEYLATLDCQSGIIKVWNMRTGLSTATMAHGGPAEALNWSANGECLASGGNDRMIRIWAAKSGQELRKFSATAPVRALAFSPDDKMLAVGCVTNDAQLLEASTGTFKRTFQTHSEIVHLLKFSPDGRNLVIGSLTHEYDPGDTRVWSLDQEGSLDLGKSTTGVSFSSDCRQLLVNDRTGTIRLWDLNQRAEIDRFSARAVSAESLPDGRIFAPGHDGVIRVFHTRESGIVQLKGYPNALRTLAFSPDNRWLVAAGMDRQLFVWNAPGGLLAGIYTNHLERTPAVAFSPNGRVATASLDSGVQLWDPASRRMIWQSSLLPDSDAYWLVFSPDGHKLYAASQTQTITVLDAATGRRLNAINGLGSLLDGLAISPDGRLLAVCEKVKLSVWFADGSRKLWETPANPERCAAFSPDGKWIATGDHDATVSLWEVASAGHVRRTLRGHTGAVSGVSFHPDGTRLVSSSFDGQVKLWELKSGVELLSIPLPGGNNVWHALFSPDGKTIAAAGGDGLVTLWKAQ